MEKGKEDAKKETKIQQPQQVQKATEKSAKKEENIPFPQQLRKEVKDKQFSNFLEVFRDAANPFKKRIRNNPTSASDQGGLTPRLQARRLGVSHSAKGAGLLHFWVLPRLNLDSGCWRKLGHA
ncbi:hypothetical protein PIB30_093147 [Stylosanthes scabra]|uniref:Uncharacterized protein n=1 Tax=Stylosanthes scabra TaxID=79078 RepID=A0ABU6RW14_9FABA|nr:hypothetical protein [Stylosanthes scabra]